MPGHPIALGSRHSSPSRSAPDTPEETFVRSAPETPRTTDDLPPRLTHRPSGSRSSTMSQKDMRLIQNRHLSEKLSTPQRRMPSPLSMQTPAATSRQAWADSDSEFKGFDRVAHELMLALRAVAMEETHCSLTRARALHGLAMSACAHLLNGTGHGSIQKVCGSSLSHVRN